MGWRGALPPAWPVPWGGQGPERPRHFFSSVRCTALSSASLPPPFPWDGPGPGSPQRRAPLLQQAGVADLEKPTPGSAPSCPDIQKAWALRGGGSEPQGNSGLLCSEGSCPGSLGVWGAGGLWLEQEVTSVQVAPSEARILWEDNEVE